MLTPFLTSWTPNCTPKCPGIHVKYNKIQQKDPFSLKIGMVMFLEGSKPMVPLKFWSKLMLTPFMTSHTQNCTPKWPEIHVEHNKIQCQGPFSLGIGMTMFLECRKPIVTLKLWNKLMLTPLLTSQTCNCTQKCPEIHIKHNII